MNTFAFYVSIFYLFHVVMNLCYYKDFLLLLFLIFTLESLPFIMTSVDHDFFIETLSFAHQLSSFSYLLIYNDCHESPLFYSCCTYFSLYIICYIISLNIILIFTAVFMSLLNQALSLNTFFS